MLLGCIAKLVLALQVEMKPVDVCEEHLGETVPGCRLKRPEHRSRLIRKGKRLVEVVLRGSVTVTSVFSISLRMLMRSGEVESRGEAVDPLFDGALEIDGARHGVWARSTWAEAILCCVVMWSLP